MGIHADERVVVGIAVVAHPQAGVGVEWRVVERQGLGAQQEPDLAHDPACQVAHQPERDEVLTDLLRKGEFQLRPDFLLDEITLRRTQVVPEHVLFVVLGISRVGVGIEPLVV